MHQTLIFEQDVAKSKDERRAREHRKLSLHRAWLNSILHLTFSGLQINDVLFPLSFAGFGGNRNFLAGYFYCRWLEDQKMRTAFMPIEGLFLLPASIQAVYRLLMLPPSGMGNIVALLPIIARFPSFVTFTFGFSISPFLVFLFLLLSHSLFFLLRFMFFSFFPFQRWKCK